MRRLPTAAARTIVMLIGLALISLGGCTRSHYRRQADRDAQALVEEKAQHPWWNLEDFRAYPDPRSRLFDPDNPDRPPMPVDDPVSHQFMHQVDGKRGWRRWHANGDTPFHENPAWLDYLPLDEEGNVLLTAEEAVRLGRLHSRNYQLQLEELYLSALDVSFERFRFDTQFFGGYFTEFVADGRLRSGGGGESSSTLTAGTFPPVRGIRARTLGATGTDLIVGFANSLVWQFSGPDTHATATLLDFAMIQPLLRNAGRDRVLERLTFAERTLLGNVREMENYQRAFYVQIMTGRDPGSGPTRRGGVFGAGLEGFSGIAGGFGRIVTGGGGGGGGTAAGAGIAGGYLGLLQIKQTIRNREFNIASQRINLAQLRESLEEARRTQGLPGAERDDKARLLRANLQVAQAQQALFNAESQLLNAKYDYETTIDTFKITLGLPPQIKFKIEDPLIEPLQLLNQQSLQLHGCLKDVQRRMGDITERLLELEAAAADADGRMRKQLRWSPEVAELLSTLRVLSDEAERLRRRLVDDFLPETARDAELFLNVLPARAAQVERLRQKIDQRAERLTVSEGDLCDRIALEIDPAVFDSSQLRAIAPLLAEQRAQVTERLEAIEHPLSTLRADLATIVEQGPNLDPIDLADRLRARVLFQGPKLLTDLSTDTLNVLLLQARARVHKVVLTPIDLDPVTALEIARVNRRDWMNARASVVDTWRLIQFNADQLQSTLDVFFSGDIANTGDNPFRLNKATGRLRVGVQFEAPLTRLAERNTYRQSLLEYQQAKRNYMLFVDQVARGLRQTLRTIEANQINFEARRHAVVSAVEQIIINDAIQTEVPNDTSGATAARDSVSALSDLLNAQNDFLSVWVNYEVLRRTLDFDLGTIQVDEEGLWMDPGPIDFRSGLPMAEVCPAPEVFVLPDLPEEVLRQPYGREEIGPGIPQVPPVHVAP